MSLNGDWKCWESSSQFCIVSLVLGCLEQSALPLPIFHLQWSGSMAFCQFMVRIIVVTQNLFLFLFPIAVCGVTTSVARTVVMKLLRGYVTIYRKTAIVWYIQGIIWKKEMSNLSNTHQYKMHRFSIFSLHFVVVFFCFFFCFFVIWKCFVSFTKLTWVGQVCSMTWFL